MTSVNVQDVDFGSAVSRNTRDRSNGSSSAASPTFPVKAVIRILISAIPRVSRACVHARTYTHADKK